MAGGQDREPYTAGPLGAAYRRCLEEGFAQGPSGYARDLVSVLRPWPFPPQEITAPVTLWYGGRDTSTVHSPDLGSTLEARLPRGRRHVLRSEGSSLLWTRSTDILTELAVPAPTE